MNYIPPVGGTGKGASKLHDFMRKMGGHGKRLAEGAAEHGKKAYEGAKGFAKEHPYVAAGAGVGLAGGAGLAAHHAMSDGDDDDLDYEGMLKKLRGHVGV